MNNINILTANINRFARYSYIILKRMMTHRLNIYKILFRYILHIIIIITYKLYKYNCDFYMSPNVVIVIDNNDNMVYRISLNDCGVQSINNNYAQEYIENKQIETIFDSSNILQLGMTYNEVEKIYGKPLIIDEINESYQYFQMWTYNLDSKKTYLYFKNNRLIRIDN